MSRGLIHNSLQIGTKANRPTAYISDYDVAFYYATDEDVLYVATKPTSGSTATWVAASGPVEALADANASIPAVAGSRKYVIANVSADRTFTLPALADSVGASYSFIAQVGAADGHDWIFATAATDELFAGGLTTIDVDASPVAAGQIVANQSSHDALQINLPAGGTRVDIFNDGSYWVVSGIAMSTTAPAFS